MMLRLRRSLARVFALALTIVAGAVVPAARAGAELVKPGAPVVTDALAGAQAGTGAGAVAIHWQTPTVHGSSPISAYLYSISLDGGHVWSAPASLGNFRYAYSSAIPALACHNTAPGSKGCRYRIYAMNSVGIGSPSKDVPLWVAPSAPTPTSIETDSTFAGVLLFWSRARVDGGLPVTYTVLASMDAGPYAEVSTTTFQGASAACTGSQICSYRVRATNSQGSSALSVAKALVTAPGGPKIAAAESVSDDLGSGVTSVNLSWNAPESGMAATSYQLQRCSIRGGVTTGCNLTSGAWGHTATFAPAGVAAVTTTQPCGAGLATCRYRVRALNARRGPGVWRMTGIEPWAPYSVQVVPGSTKGTVKVTFAGPAESGAAPKAAKHYQVVFCTTSCTDYANWRDSGLKVPYPPTGNAPFTAGTFVCKPGPHEPCSVRMRFIDGLGHMSALTSVIKGSPKA